MDAAADARNAAKRFDEIPPEHFDLSPRQAGLLIGVGRDTIVRWADRGLLPEWRTPSGYRRYRRSDVLHLIESRIA